MCFSYLIANIFYSTISPKRTRAYINAICTPKNSSQKYFLSTSNFKLPLLQAPRRSKYPRRSYFVFVNAINSANLYAFTAFYTFSANFFEIKTAHLQTFYQTVLENLFSPTFLSIYSSKHIAIFLISSVPVGVTLIKFN